MDFKERICREVTRLVREVQYERMCSRAEGLGLKLDQAWCAPSGEGFKAVSARLMVESENVLVVAFRSTFGNDEWMEYPNKYWKRRFMVHDGDPADSKRRLFALWSLTLDEVWNAPGDGVEGRRADTLRSTVWRHLNAGYRVWLAGHSKGGAVATTAAGRLLLGDSVDDESLADPSTRRPSDSVLSIAGGCLSKLSVFTFNAPLAFSVPLAECYEKQLVTVKAEHMRLEHRSDRVRKLPACDGLVHVGHQKLYGEDVTEDRGVMVGGAIAAAGLITALVSAGKAIVNNH